jgi:diguanylate cyclase (GGDEF)-like protein
LDRLAPIARDAFAPMPIEGVADYLSAIAEIPRAPTRAVLLGVDPNCRRLDSAIAAIRDVAGTARVVICCEPAYETIGKQAVAAGVHDYVIFPPSAGELEAALDLPAATTRRTWLDHQAGPVAPAAHELELVAELLGGVDSDSGHPLQQMAELICAAISARRAVVMIDDRIGEWQESGFDAPDADADAVGGAPAGGAIALIEPIQLDGRRIGQIRVGPSARGGYAHDDSIKLRHYASVFARLADAADRARRWRELAYRDDLTGLVNRRYLLATLDDLLHQAAYKRTHVTVLVFDIDDFKRYNDQYGHPAGDAIIRETGQLFKRCCREQDVVCRFGGDEFVVVFWDADSPRESGSQHPTNVLAVINRFRKALDAHTFSRLGPEARGCLTISGGIASFPWQGRTADELLEQADAALLAAKAEGKNRFHLIGAGRVCED